jgi:tellurite resistance protein TerC
MQLWIWLAFIAFVVVMMVLDIAVVGKKDRPVPFKLAVAWTLVCVALALGFAPVLRWMYDTNLYGLGVPAKAGEAALTGTKAMSLYLQGWMLEYALSVDNLFVFALIFRYFAVPAQSQHRVLVWGIIAAMVLRGVMIFLGAAILKRFEWSYAVFGAFLVYTAFSMIGEKEAVKDFDAHWTSRVARMFLPVHPGYMGSKFFVRVQDKATGKTITAMTTLFLVLLVVEFTDVVFAVDSIPAIFGITNDPFIVFTSNVFAILGLRSLYFAIATMLDRFHRLKYALAFILAFIGVKMILKAVWHIEVPTNASLILIASSLFVGVVSSLLTAPPAKNPDTAPPEA